MDNSGDCNGDGIADLIISAIQENGSNGKIYIIFGSGTNLQNDIYLYSVSSSMGVIITGNAWMTGIAVSLGGDVNNDGINEILISSPYDSSYAGRVYVIRGSASLASFSLSSPPSNTLVFTGENAYDLLGLAATLGPDLNSDGYDEILLSAYGYNSYSGAVYLIYGSSGLTSMNMASLTSSMGAKLTGSSTLGSAFSFVGDVNSDGIPDISIGMPGYLNTGGIVTLK